MPVRRARDGEAAPCARVCTLYTCKAVARTGEMTDVACKLNVEYISTHTPDPINHDSTIDMDTFVAPSRRRLIVHAHDLNEISLCAPSAGAALDACLGCTRGI